MVKSKSVSHAGRPAYVVKMKCAPTFSMVKKPAAADPVSFQGFDLEALLANVAVLKEN